MKRGFTLLEMLVVIVIIIVLTSIVFKMAKVTMRSGEKADCIQTLERVKDALESFKSAYGSYPPVSQELSVCGHQHCKVCYIYELTNMPAPVKQIIAGDPKHETYDYTIYEYGLVSYLVPRLTPSPDVHTDNSQWVPDTAMDILNKKKWASYLDGIIAEGYVSNSIQATSSGAAKPFFSGRMTINDPWGHVIMYDSKPPYKTYSLWSVGPDGIDGTKDDIYAKK